MASQINAKRIALKEKQALALLEEVDEVYATKGKRVVHLDLKKDRPDRATLTSLLLGPAGNLRAPTLQKDRTLIVGFDEATYRRVFD